MIEASIEIPQHLIYFLTLINLFRLENKKMMIYYIYLFPDNLIHKIRIKLPDFLKKDIIYNIITLIFAGALIIYVTKILM